MCSFSSFLQIQNVLYDFFQKPDLHLGKYAFTAVFFLFFGGGGVEVTQSTLVLMRMDALKVR